MRALKFAAVVAALALSATATATSAHADSPPMPMPSKPSGLTPSVQQPAAVDPPSGYVPQGMCYPTDQPGTVKLRDLVLKTYGVGGRGNISRGCTEGVSEHSEGRAWDWMINRGNAEQKAAAADFLAWTTRNNGENARRLGIMYMIHNQKIWAIYRASEGWRPSSGHTDHIHISLSWNGARGATSFWTGKIAPVDRGPCSRFAGTLGVLTSTARTGACPNTSTLVKKTSRPNRYYGSTGSDVKTAQQLLGIAQSGAFDRSMWWSVRRFQQANELPHTGTLDAPTWSTLSPADVTSRTTSGYTQDKAIAYGLERSPTLSKPMVGTDVAILQIALRMPIAQRNGYFGPLTVAAVKRLQAASGLSQTGRVGKAEWQAMAAARSRT